MAASSQGTGLNLRKWSWLVGASFCILCLSSSVQSVSEPAFPVSRSGSPLLAPPTCAFTAPLSATSLFRERLAGISRRSGAATCQRPGVLRTYGLLGRKSLSEGPGLPGPTDALSPTLLQRNGLFAADPLQLGPKPQTQLRVLADICEEERDYREADIQGTRLFVTGLPASVDDIRLYLAFEEYGRVLEAQVAKPGLGFVVFEDTDTADEALAGMEGEEISGKEIRVKRARSFYIRKEEEARLKLAQAAREREMRTAALAEEQSRRVRLMEEQAYARAQGGLSAHARSYDVRGQRRLVLEEMRAEGLLDLSNPLPYTPTPQTLDAKPVRPGAGGGRRKGSGRGPAYVNGAQTNGREMQERMQGGAAAAGAEGKGGAAWNLSEEERIKKQAMIEIMKEGDKLSKSGLKGVEVNVNIAQLIRERVEQIKRYEMLRDNRDLLSNITFTSFPTQNVRTTGIPGYTFGNEEEDGVEVTPEEEALVKMIADDRGGAGGGAAGGGAAESKPATAATGKRGRGRPRKAPGQGKKTKAYVPTGRPRGRPRKTPKPE